MSLRRAVFLDKDGTLIEDIPYNVDPARIRLAADSVAGLRALQGTGYRLVIVSNQSGVAHGYFREEALAEVERRLRELLAEHGVTLAGFYYCPHHPSGACECRKPHPGMLHRAARELGLNLARSWLIGDILNDVEAGRRAGCTTVLLDNGNETEWVLTPARTPDYRVATIDEAARVITGEG